MKSKHCVACGKRFQVRPQTPHQSYCSAPVCQRARRQEWQRVKLEVDPDYQENKARVQKAWRDRNPQYSQQYRDSHPEYVERNRSTQHGRNAKSAVDTIAKTDASSLGMPLPSGIYQVRLVTPDAIAKMDVWTVEITAHACQCAPPGGIAKTGRDR